MRRRPSVAATAPARYRARPVPGRVHRAAAAQARRRHAARPPGAGRGHAPNRPRPRRWLQARGCLLVRYPSPDRARHPRPPPGRSLRSSASRHRPAPRRGTPVPPHRLARASRCQRPVPPPLQPIRCRASLRTPIPDAGRRGSPAGRCARRAAATRACATAVDRTVHPAPMVAPVHRVRRADRTGRRCTRRCSRHARGNACRGSAVRRPSARRACSMPDRHRPGGAGTSRRPVPTAASA